MTREPITEVLERMIEGFWRDRPDTDFQRGYLAAVLEVYGHCRAPKQYLLRNGKYLVEPRAPLTD
jgi:hypothetical protein